MGVNADVSEQVVKLGLEGFEILVKLTGNGSKNAIAMLYAILKNKEQTKGKTRLNKMLKTGKPLKIFSIKKEDLAKFANETKRYGVLYCALLDRKKDNKDGVIDIVVKDEDASRINRIIERFNLSTVENIKDNVSQVFENERETNENFNLAMIEKSPLSKPSLKDSKKETMGANKERKKTSVRKKLKKLMKEKTCEENNFVIKDYKKTKAKIRE